MLYKCDICGLHYRSKRLAESCLGWCSKHNSCNLKITIHSIEREQKKEKTDGN
ncbi:MAG: hypothetical protein KGH60_04020 [Candidatus Micrarchaeota archaeon]|nr:hypothetical protein [Candidatus Micrarchaeota archaeon]